MSGWVVASIVGGVFGVVIVVLLVFVSRAVMRTARNAGELMVALEEVQARTKVLADLEAEAGRTARVAGDAATALQDLHRSASARKPEGDRRDGRR